MFTMLMRLLIYLPPPPSHLAAIYYTHTIAGPSVLVLSPSTYVVGLTTAYIFTEFTDASNEDNADISKLRILPL